MFANRWFIVAFCCLAASSQISFAQTPKFQSHPPLRTPPPPRQQPRPEPLGLKVYVDAKLGNDNNSGTIDEPWKTIKHALTRGGGCLIYLRGGIYYEQLYISLRGTKNKPITIRSFPREQAIIDGSLPEFVAAPEDAWEPSRDGGVGEFQSTKSWPNLRDVVGYFGDSQVGLQTYWHRQDLQAISETFSGGGGKGADEKDVDPIYLGPGLWYNAAYGTIHCRLGRTHLPEPLVNYQGETDPRKVPLSIAPYRSTPVFFDQAEHVILQDLVIRGGGYVTVLMEQAKHIALDNCTIFAGTYGIRAISTEHLALNNCGLHGSLAPWTFRSDASKRDYPGRPHRNLSRLNTHALIELDAGRESSVWAYPQNDRWTISNCHFTDSHDGLYLGAMHVEFHHNLIENLQDDGIYLSPMYQRHKLDGTDPLLDIHHNVFRKLLTALAFGGNEPNTHDKILVHHNVFDLREPIMAGRMSETRKEPSLSTGKLIGDHGSPPWSTLTLFHNTIIAGGSRDALMASGVRATAEQPKSVFNNLFFHTDRLPVYTIHAAGSTLTSDHNLFWSPSADEKTADAFFKKWRASPSFAENKKIYVPGSDSNSRVADPKFIGLNDDVAASDYRLSDTSPAIGAGLHLDQKTGRPAMIAGGPPDVGAIPVGGKMFQAGRP